MPHSSEIHVPSNRKAVPSSLQITIPLTNSSASLSIGATDPQTSDWRSVTNSRKRTIQAHPECSTTKQSHLSIQTVGFIGDSTISCVVEDMYHTAPTIIQNNWERNIALFRGKTSDQISSQSKPLLENMLSSGVTTFILSFGTVDLLQSPHNKNTPSDIATIITSTLQKFVQTISPGQIIYLIPAPNKSVSYPFYAEFLKSVTQFAADNGIHTVSTFSTMLHHLELEPGYRSYNEVVRQCLVPDGVHWGNEIARTILTDALHLVNFRLKIKLSPHSCFRLAVQKNIQNSCYTCGSRSHRYDDCEVSRPSCTNCGKKTHTKQACGFLFLPCRHCGTFAHNNTNNKSDCPSYYSSRK